MEILVRRHCAVLPSVKDFRLLEVGDYIWEVHCG